MVNQSQSLVLKQSQQLVLTPQMQQSLKILQLSSLDLNDLLEVEMEKNPLLEKEEEENSETKEEQVEASSEEAEIVADSEKDSFDNLNSDNFSENEASPLDNDQSEGDYAVANSGDYDEYRTNNSKSHDDIDAGTVIEKNYSKEETLREHIIEQINLDFTDNAEIIIANHLMDFLDNKGYLAQVNYEIEISALSKKLGCSLEDIEKVISRLQKFDPAGVFARNLQECLRIQLREKDRLDPAMEKLLENLELLAKGETQKLKKICGVDEEDLTLMIAEIKSLNPRPASNFTEENAATKIPDLYLVKKGGVWDIELNYDIMPRLRVKKDYYKKVKSGKIKEEHKEYLNSNLNTANFLIRAISQRYDSILKVAKAIVDSQTDFFEKGINYLRPMTMKQIADVVELHESTVGRVVANKYISTPRGVLELRYFFTNSLTSISSENDVSSQSAKNMIREAIESETKILSDDEIAKILNQKGVNIARRTVAKYREAMHIPTSADRKRLRRIK